MYDGRKIKNGRRHDAGDPDDEYERELAKANRDRRHPAKDRSHTIEIERGAAPSSLSFPGQGQSSYPPAYGTYQWGGSNAPAPMYPPYFKPPMDPYGAAAMTLGIVGMCTFWLSFIPYSIGTTIFILVIIITGLGLVFGIFAFGTRRPRSIAGLVGAILSMIALTLACIMWVYTHGMLNMYL